MTQQLRIQNNGKIQSYTIERAGNPGPDEASAALGKTYTVQGGDSMWTIWTNQAKDQGVSWSDFKAANQHIFSQPHQGNGIWKGDQVVIPGPARQDGLTVGAPTDVERQKISELFQPITFEPDALKFRMNPATGQLVPIDLDEKPHSPNEKPHAPEQTPRPSGAGVDQEKVLSDTLRLRAAMTTTNGTDEKTLVSILSNRSNAEIAAIKQLYRKTYGESLETSIKGDTSGNFETTLLGLAKGKRNGEPLSRSEALLTASALNEALDNWGGTNDGQLMSILTNNSKSRLSTIAREYESLFGRSLRDAVASDTSGWYRDALLAQLPK